MSDHIDENNRSDRYVSTRGAAPLGDFETVLSRGLACDNGLYLPSAWPKIDKARLRSWQSLNYHDLTLAITAPFIGPSAFARFEKSLQALYKDFHHPAVAPLMQLDHRLFLLELFHGPTLAFKDFALQMLARLLNAWLTEQGQQATILVATSGDTGSATLAACQNHTSLRTFILFPEGRISEAQRRQMMASGSEGSIIAIDGDFDACQRIVKSLLADHALCTELGLTSANSINWVRLMAQTVYYFWAALALGAPDRSLVFVVPSGNFGNALSCWIAAQMGLPIELLVVATNHNDSLAHYFNQGHITAQPITPSLSPSMDIQIPSNLERLLFESTGRNGQTTQTIMHNISTQDHLVLESALWEHSRRGILAQNVDDSTTLATISRVKAETGLWICPHSAVGLAAEHLSDVRCQTQNRDAIVVALATAHPAKFPETMMRAVGQLPPAPERLASALEVGNKPCICLPADTESVRRYIQTEVFGGYKL